MEPLIDYTIEERISCCFWFDIYRSTEDVQNKFRECYGSKKMPPERPNIRFWYQRFVKTGCLIHDDNGNLDLNAPNHHQIVYNHNGQNCCRSSPQQLQSMPTSSLDDNENEKNSGHNCIENHNVGVVVDSDNDSQKTEPSSDQDVSSLDEIYAIQIKKPPKKRTNPNGVNKAKNDANSSTITKRSISHKSRLPKRSRSKKRVK